MRVKVQEILESIKKNRFIIDGIEYYGLKNIIFIEKEFLDNLLLDKEFLMILNLIKPFIKGLK